MMTDTISAPPIPQLPAEVITLIASHIPDQPTALSFALASRSFAACSEARLWRDLDLFLPPYYGERPMVNDHEIGTEDHAFYDRLFGEIGDFAYAAGLRSKVRSYLSSSNERRWRMARNLRFTNRPGPIHSIIQVLDCVSTTLETLSIDAPPSLVAERTQPQRDHTYIDFSWLGSDLQFPKITHIRLGRDSVRYYEFIPILYSACPNLIDFYVDLRDMEVSEPDENLLDYFTPSRSQTEIRRLQILVSMDDDVVVDLLRDCPQLRQISIGGEGSDVVFVLNVLVLRDHVRDVHWNTTLPEFDTLWKQIDVTHRPGFPALQILILKFGSWFDLFVALPSIPTLQTLYLDLPPLESIDNPTTCPNSSGAQHMVTQFSSRLRASAALYTIRTVRQLDRFEHDVGADIFSAIRLPEFEGDVVGTVRSVKHGDDEVLHARLYINMIEREDYRQEAKMYRFTSSQCCIRYDDQDDITRYKTHEQFDKPVWHDYTDFEGVPVPLDVISGMMAVQGLSDDWEGRGVEVGDEAWQVLLDWHNQRETV